MVLKWFMIVRYAWGGMGKKAPKEPIVSLTTRYPRDLHERLRRVADRERRSLNDQIIYVLERWLESQTADR